MNKKVLIFFILAALFMCSCGTDEPANTIKIDGSSTVFPITEAVAEKYRSEAPGTQISVEFSGTGGGFQKFVRGETDINNASREISEDEIKLAKKNEVEYIQLSVAYDGIAVVVNPANDWVNHLTVAELRQVWEASAQEEITYWNDIREEWPEEELHLFGPGVASGTYDYFTETVVGENGESRGDFESSEDDSVLVEGVSNEDGALGFFGLGHFAANQEQLKLIAIKDGDEKPVKPTTETVSGEAYSPLSRPLFIYIRKEAAQRQNVQDFVNFYLDNASEIAQQVGYVAMPDSIYDRQREKFKKFYSDSNTSGAE